MRRDVLALAIAAAVLAEARRAPGNDRDPNLLELWREVGLVSRPVRLIQARLAHRLEGHTDAVHSVSITPESTAYRAGTSSTKSKRTMNPSGVSRSETSRGVPL